jgi:two-component system, NtrC family, response regulator PilR
MQEAVGVRRVLVVDDDPVQTRVLIRVLERDGYDCSPATSLADALALLSDDQFDLVLTDLRLAGADGLDLVRHVRDHHPGVASIVVTGMIDPEIGEQARAEGAFDLLEKPFDPATLVALVDDALGRGSPT